MELAERVYRNRQEILASARGSQLPRPQPCIRSGRTTSSNLRLKQAQSKHTTIRFEPRQRHQRLCLGLLQLKSFWRGKCSSRIRTCREGTISTNRWLASANLSWSLRQTSSSLVSEVRIFRTISDSNQLNEGKTP